MQPDQLDSFLAVFRKHNVVKFKNDAFEVEFFNPILSTPSLVSSALTEARESTKEVLAEAARTEPPGPAPDVVEPTQHAIEDVLYGAK